MPDLKGTKTHENLKAAFGGESQANRRYLYFAKQADIEGYPEVAGLFKNTADAETGHAHGHLDFLKVVGDPATVIEGFGQENVRQGHLELAGGQRGVVPVGEAAGRVGGGEVAARRSLGELLAELAVVGKA